jgi:hypothetical protein
MGIATQATMLDRILGSTAPLRARLCWGAVALRAATVSFTMFQCKMVQ